MKISEEKKYLYSMMKSVTEERNKLLDIYHGLTNRLNELNKLELELQNVKPEVKEEVKKVKEEEIFEEDEEEDNLPLSHFIDLFNKKNIEGVQIKEVDYIIPKTEIEREKDKLPKRSAHVNIDRVTGIIAEVLKDFGVPMSVKDIYRKVNDKHETKIGFANFRNNLLPRATKKNKRIDKAYRGYYQYKQF